VCVCVMSFILAVVEYLLWLFSTFCFVVFYVAFEQVIIVRISPNSQANFPLFSSTFRLTFGAFFR